MLRKEEGGGVLLYVRNTVNYGLNKLLMPGLNYCRPLLSSKAVYKEMQHHLEEQVIAFVVFMLLKF